jgi:hypothetical protein
MKNVAPKAFLIISSIILIFSLCYSISFFMGNVCKLDLNIDTEQFIFFFLCFPTAVLAPFLGLFIFKVALYFYRKNK